MRIAYLDCFAGISGDMFLGALIDAGVDAKVFHEATAALNFNAFLKIERVDRSGITATRIMVLENGQRAETAHKHEHPQQQPHEHHHHPKTQHFHKAGYSHDRTHDHEDDHRQNHIHGRSLSVIRTLIQSSSLAEQVKQTAIHTFELLGASEAKIHNVDIERIHFHEVGAVDAIVDIVCASAGIHALAIDAWHSSSINVGSGMVDCAHGRFPIPAPATADLLRGLPTYSAHIERELTTPTGAAILRTLNPTFGPQPPMRIQQIGYGAGTRNPKDFPNVLRLSIGESTDTQLHTVTVLETAIDDLSPQILAHVTERALALGALDVMSTAVQMKKGRLGTLITILSDDAHAPTLEDLLLRETTTLGVRIRHDQRTVLDRFHTTVSTPYGPIRIKLATRNDETYNAAPEFEDCRTAATQHNVPLKQVLQAAIAAYQNSSREQ
jgi:pyridinium-3,5-bisthiocarboxylic acid mononucleotide nickel chelatase